LCAPKSNLFFEELSPTVLFYLFEEGAEKRDGGGGGARREGAVG